MTVTGEEEGEGDMPVTLPSERVYIHRRRRARRSKGRQLAFNFSGVARTSLARSCVPEDIEDRTRAPPLSLDTSIVI